MRGSRGQAGGGPLQLEPVQRLKGVPKEGPDLFQLPGKGGRVAKGQGLPLPSLLLLLSLLLLTALWDLDAKDAIEGIVYPVFSFPTARH